MSISLKTILFGINKIQMFPSMRTDFNRLAIMNWTGSNTSFVWVFKIHLTVSQSSLCWGFQDPFDSQSVSHLFNSSNYPTVY